MTLKRYQIVYHFYGIDKLEMNNVTLKKRKKKTN